VESRTESNSGFENAWFYLGDATYGQWRVSVEKTLTLGKRRRAKGVSEKTNPLNSCILNAWLNQLSLFFFQLRNYEGGVFLINTFHFVYTIQTFFFLFHKLKKLKYISNK